MRNLPEDESGEQSDGPRTLEEVLEDERRQASVLRGNGHENEAKLIERVCRRVTEAAEEYLRFLVGSDAQLRSNHSVEWLRSQYPMWERMGHAKKLAGRRYYRTLVIPQRGNLAAAYEDGKRAGRKASAPAMLIEHKKEKR